VQQLSLHRVVDEACDARQIVQSEDDAQLFAKAQWARRKWWRRGGWCGWKVALRSAEVVKAARQAELQRQAMQRYFEKGSLSGAALEPVGEHVLVDLVGEEAGTKRKKPQRESQRAKRVRFAKAARARAEAEEELRERAAEDGDCRGAYPITAVLDVRYDGAELQALVQWEGAQWRGHDSWDPDCCLACVGPEWSV